MYTVNGLASLIEYQDYKEMSHLKVNDRIINVAKNRIKRNIFAYNVIFLSE